MSAFFDTNIIVYGFGKGPKRDVARLCMADGGVISAQVLNEFTNVSRRKYQKPWAEIENAIGVLTNHFDAVLPLTIETHQIALALARDHNFAFYDALIVASALEAGCETLFSEDLQDGRAIGGLRIVNPFAR